MLFRSGVEVLVLPTEPVSAEPARDAPGRVALPALLTALGARRMTNILVEGGGALLGALHDQRLLDEVHVFVAPRLLGGAGALSPVLGWGVDHPSAGLTLDEPVVEVLDGDVYLRGRVRGE